MEKWIRRFPAGTLDLSTNKSGRLRNRPPAPYRDKTLNPSAILSKKSAVNANSANVRIGANSA